MSRQFPMPGALSTTSPAWSMSAEWTALKPSADLSSGVFSAAAAGGAIRMLWQNTTTGDRSIWFMNGSTYVSAALLPNVSTAWKIVAVGDFNADGKPDLVWQRPGTGESSIWFMNGSTYSSAALLPVVPSAWRIAGAADFDGDGRPDLVWQNVNTGERSIWLMNGSNYASAAVLPTVPIQWSIAATMLPPHLVANAGADQDKNRGQSTTLDGS